MLDQSQVDLDEIFGSLSFLDLFHFSRFINSFSAEAPVTGCGLAELGQNPVRWKIPIGLEVAPTEGTLKDRRYWLEVKIVSTFIGGSKFYGKSEIYFVISISNFGDSTWKFGIYFVISIFNLEFVGGPIPLSSSCVPLSHF